MRGRCSTSSSSSRSGVLVTSRNRPASNAETTSAGRPAGFSSPDTQTFVSITTRRTVPLPYFVSCRGDVRFYLVWGDRRVDPRSDAIEQVLELRLPAKIVYDSIP